MAGFVDILFNAAGGGIFGSALHLVSSWVETKNKIALLNAQVNAAEKTEAWKAFAASQASSAPIQLPANTPAWVSSIYLLVDAIRNLTRPMLTWCAVGLVIFVFVKTEPAQRNAMTDEIIFGSFTAIFWWFGSRYTKR